MSRPITLVWDEVDRRGKAKQPTVQSFHFKEQQGITVNTFIKQEILEFTKLWTSSLPVNGNDRMSLPTACCGVPQLQSVNGWLRVWQDTRREG